jgi:hypothetical protein
MKLAHPFQQMTTRELQKFHEKNKWKSKNDPGTVNRSGVSENNHKKHIYQDKGNYYESTNDHPWKGI